MHNRYKMTLRSFCAHIYIIVLALLLLGAPLMAEAKQSLRARAYGLRDGLPSHNISNISQDCNDVIWIATWNGLTYFDGYEFSNFRSSASAGKLSSNRIVDLLPDTAGHVWITTFDHNVYYLDTQTGKFYPIREKLQKTTPQKFTAKGLASSEGYVWLLGDETSFNARIDVSALEQDSCVEIYDIKRLDPDATEILKVEVDGFGNEWVFTNSGIQLYGSDVAAKGDFKFQQSMGDGNTYLVTADGTPYKYKQGDSSIKVYHKPSGLKRINDLCQYDENYLIVATNSGVMVYSCNANSVRMLSIKGVASSNLEISEIRVDSNNRIWALTRSGKVVLYDNVHSTGRIIPYDHIPAEPTRSIRSLWVEDKFGNVWLAPAGGVFGYYDSESDKIVPFPIVSEFFNYASIPNIEVFFVDNQSNLWLSSSHNLVAVNFQNEYYRAAELNDNDEIRSICPTDDGAMLLGTASGNIAKFDASGKFISYLGQQSTGQSTSRVVQSTSRIAFADRIYTMKQDAQQNIWVGTKGKGLFVISPSGAVRNYVHDPNDPYSIPCDTVYHFNQDNLGNIWVATYGSGLLLAKPSTDGSYSFISANNELKNYPIDAFRNVRRITNTPEGAVVASCTNGLLTFSNKFESPADIKFYATGGAVGDSTMITTGDVMHSLLATDGTLYILPHGEHIQRIPSAGILKPNLQFQPLNSGDTPHSILQATNLFGNALSMIEDMDNNIVIVFESTLVVYNPKTGSAYTLVLKAFDNTSEFTEAEPVINPINGDIWIGGSGGATIVSPGNVEASSYVPPIVITGVQLQGDAERRRLLNPGRILVPPGVRNLSITFAALDYPENHNVQYAYKIDKEHDWTYIDNANTVYLNQLNPGTHRLYIRSTNADGIWVDNTREFDILVKPTFMQSIWAKILIAIGVLIFLFALIYLYTLYRKSQMMKIVHRKEHDFFIEASHRLRTPLTLIGSPVVEVLESEQLTDKGREHLNKVRRNANEMLELVNSMLERGFRSSDAVDDNNVSTYITSDATSNGVVGAEAESSASNTDANSRAKSDSRITILIVEDNKDLREFLRDILLADYNVVEAPNGKIGLQKAEKLQPDFIVTDVTMPEMDGLTMVHNIKQNKSLSHIPIIVLSAKASIEDRVQGLREGIDDYITKPFSATYLRQRIASIIAQRGLLQQTYFEQLGRDIKSMPEAPVSDGATAEGLPVELAQSTSVHEAQAAEPTPHEYRLESPSITDADQEMMAKLLKYIETRISDENLKIEDLADAVNMGRTVFYGKIKALVGMSPSDFVRKLRMQRAEELVVRSKLNFSQIAYNVGFSDPKYFTKCFKKETGMTPSEYRQKSNL